MSEANPAPAGEAFASSSSALDPDTEVWVMFVSQPTQDNYSQIARDQAAVRGVDVGQVMGELAEQFETLHTRQPMDGYDHLAAWARQHDPSAGQGPTGLAALQARSLESARRDPYQAVIGDQGLVEQAVAAQRAADEAAAAAGSAPSIDPASGLLPNPGPLPVPDVPTGPDPAQQSEQPGVQAQPAPPAEQPEQPEQQPEQPEQPEQSEQSPEAAPAGEGTPTPPATGKRGSTAGS